MQLKLKSETILTIDKTNKYYSFITKESYNLIYEFRDNFITFLTTLFACLNPNNSNTGFVLIYDKIEKESKNKDGFKELLNEINKYIDAYNSCLKHPGDDIKMARMKAECWEILGRNETQLNATQMQLINTQTQLTETRKELVDLKDVFEKNEADLKERFAKTESDLKKGFAKTEVDLKKGFAKEIARLEKIIKDLLG